MQVPFHDLLLARIAEVVEKQAGNPAFFGRSAEVTPATLAWQRLQSHSHHAPALRQRLWT